MRRFEGKVVLITGAATGIGQATALAFAAEGARIMIGDIDQRAQETVSLVTDAGGIAAFQPCNVTIAADATALVAACIARFGRLDAAFNNAGILPPPAPFHEMPESDLDRTLAVDLKGVFLCMQAQVRHFLAHGGGAIVNTASVAGMVADPNMSPYVAAKHGVVGLTKAVAIEYARMGIRVNAIAPGFIATPMTQAWADDSEVSQAIYDRNVIGRAGRPEEVAGTVLHLCSDSASFINGSLFVIDGGQTAQ